MSSSVQIACPSCGALNRIPEARLGEKPRCGKCQAAIFEGRPLELGSATFDRYVIRSELPVLVDFWAPWCGPCVRMAPAFAEAAQRLEPRVRLLKLDTDAHPNPAQQFGIQSIPTLILFRSGHEIARRLGAMRSDELVRWVEAELSGS